MSDRLTIEQRHNNMAAIRGRDTKPEILVRKFLWSRGFRYRLNHPRLPGKPDIVLRKYRTCILVNGCFWHGHEGCKFFVLPKSRTEFWQAKIDRNPAVADGSACTGTRGQRDICARQAPASCPCCVWMPYNGCAVPLSSCPFMDFYLE